MKGAAMWDWGYEPPGTGGRFSGLGKALHGCIVWLQVDGGPSAGGVQGGAGHQSRRVCPYEGACTQRGRCFLPQRPRC